MKILSTVGANLRAQSLQEKFHHRFAARFCYQRPHKVTSITKRPSFHVQFTVYVLNTLARVLLASTKFSDFELACI